MNALTNFAYGDNLVRTVMRGGEPWFVGKDVCRALDIRDHHQALEKLDADERGGCSVPTPLGNQDMIIVSEPGVYRLVFRSRKPEAEKFKRWLAHEVIPAIRKTGAYGASDAAPDLQALTEQRIALDIAAEARRMYGPARGRLLWEALGLPPVPPLPDLAGDVPRDVLAQLLGHETPTGSLRERIGRMDESLREIGLIADESGLYVANSHPAVLAILHGHPRHWRALARLGGAYALTKKFGQRSHRAVCIPYSAL